MDYSYSDSWVFRAPCNQYAGAGSVPCDAGDRRSPALLRYTNRKGEVWEYALWRMIHHVVNHSTYHRGQVTNMLRLLGAQPATTDFLEFWDERQTAG